MPELAEMPRFNKGDESVPLSKSVPNNGDETTGEMQVGRRAVASTGIAQIEGPAGWLIDRLASQALGTRAVDSIKILRNRRSGLSKTQ